MFEQFTYHGALSKAGTMSTRETHPAAVNAATASSPFPSISILPFGRIRKSARTRTPKTAPAASLDSQSGEQGSFSAGTKRTPRAGLLVNVDTNGSATSQDVICPPFIATAPGKWREKYASVCAACFEARVHCTHHPERRLRLLFIGHNPSEHAWASGNFYSNPTNRMWKLLRLGGIIPDEWGPEDNNNMPSMLGVGLTDLGTEPGNDANSYKRAKMREWRSDLYGRLEAHLARVAACSAPGSAGDQRTEGRHSPAVVAFTGKRQYGQLFQPPLKRVTTGLQPPDSLPPGWPLPTSTEVWVLPSTSGRAVIPPGELEGVYIALGKRISYETWERVTVQ
ncbi:hypothetical protein CYMTET_40180 [Cymbomonas tetramitiformis]|uniref:Uracil-DNA glycosylase-like domain-containing protein n=1 Tax=Cymbomonas tetramitiformis TaxID=36881 RepID=A0AAE0C8K4_9CHLO|nr:hypothetical protein CYMTET_40180 [Cymbomonas tetramitiformis]